MVKNLLANAGNMGSILGREDSLKEEMATHSIILAWEISWTEEPGGLQFMGLLESRTHLRGQTTTVCIPYLL